MEINIEKYDILTLDNDIRYVVASILNHKNIIPHPSKKSKKYQM